MPDILSIYKTENARANVDKIITLNLKINLLSFAEKTIAKTAVISASAVISAVNSVLCFAKKPLFNSLK